MERDEGLKCQQIAGRFVARRLDPGECWGCADCGVPPALKPSLVFPLRSDAQAASSTPGELPLDFFVVFETVIKCLWSDQSLSRRFLLGSGFFALGSGLQSGVKSSRRASMEPLKAVTSQGTLPKLSVGSFLSHKQTENSICLFPLL